MKLYYHKTDGGAEYLTDTYIICPNGEKEGHVNFDTKYCVRIDGDITKDAELNVRDTEEKDVEEFSAELLFDELLKMNDELLSRGFS